MLTFKPRTSKYEATISANPIELRESEMALFTVLPSDYCFSSVKEPFLQSEQTQHVVALK
jgi:hypothetical protein